MAKISQNQTYSKLSAVLSAHPVLAQFLLTSDKVALLEVVVDRIDEVTFISKADRRRICTISKLGDQEPITQEDLVKAYRLGQNDLVRELLPQLDTMLTNGVKPTN